MKRNEQRIQRRHRRRRGLRKRIFGTPDCPRLTIYRSLQHIYAQVIDDLAGHTIVSASTTEKQKKVAHGGNRDAAKLIGQAIAERAKAKGIEQVVFDRNGYRYQGRVKSIADAAREGGLKF